MKNRIGLFLLLMSLVISNLYAEPYLAAWEGVNCNACHMNETGGYLRNDFGRNYGNTLQTFDWQGIADAAQALTHKTPTWVSAGVDFHESFGALFVPGAANIPASFNPNSPFVPLGRQSFSIAVKANEVISGVFTYNLAGSTREAYALISNMPDDAYFKLGKFTVPYGLELADDNSLIRNDLIGGNIFTFNSPTNDGMEFGIYPGDLFLNAATFNDSTNNGEFDFSAKGGINLRELTLGGTVYTQNLDYMASKLRYGTYGWTKLGPVVLLGEFDLGYDNGAAVGAGTNYTAYHASAEVDLGRDIYLRLVNEYLRDTHLSAGFDGFRDVVSLRFYPMRNLKCQVDVQRMDPTIGSASYGSGPYYAAVFDTYMFY